MKSGKIELHCFVKSPQMSFFILLKNVFALKCNSSTSLGLNKGNKGIAYILKQIFNFIKDSKVLAFSQIRIYEGIIYRTELKMSSCQGKLIIYKS